MTKREMEQVYNNYFGEVMAKTDALLASKDKKMVEDLEKQQETLRNFNKNLNETFNKWFGDLL